MSKNYKITSEIIKEFERVAPRRVFTGAEINEDYSHDEMSIYGKAYPEAVVEVLTTGEVSEIMKLCNENKIPVTPRGAGTGLVGGAVSIHGGVLLSMTRMNQILDYDLENFVVRVQPGVLLGDLAEDASKKGLFYPPDPGEKFATLGGNVSTNAGGMRAVKYGATRDYVRAMTVVLPTGHIVKLGAAVSKTSSGYSLLNLMIGSEGTLGIITELTLKLIANPKEILSLVVPYADLEDCISTVPRLIMNHLEPQALEFMERDIIISSEAYLGKSVFPKAFHGVDVAAYLLITFDGNSIEQLDAIAEKASEIILDNGALDVLIADTPALKREAWAARSSFLEAIEADTKFLDECDVVVPINKIPHYLKFVKSLGNEAGIKVKSFGHAGDGNLHIYACSNDLMEEEFKKRSSYFMEKAYEKATELGGLISGEHGIGHGKLDYLAKASGPVSMNLMEGIKKVFDPNMILNPGKVCYKL